MTATQRTRFRWLAVRLGMILLLLVLVGALHNAAAQTGISCSVGYSVVNQWSGGFQGSILITNTGMSTINGWTLTWAFPNGQTITQMWNATYAQSGANASATNLSWNASLPAGGSVNPGFLANWSTVNNAPTSFALNGTACSTGNVTPTFTPTGSVTPTRTPTSTTTRTSTPTPTATGPTPTFTATATRTNTPTPTRTNTPTPTNTPFTPPPGGLKVQYRAGETGTSVNQIRAMFSIVNSGGSAVPLSELKLRYWYTIDGVQAQEFHCDYAVVGCGNVAGVFQAMAATVPNQADYYYEVSFSTGAGSLAANGQSGEIQTRINKTDWTNYTQTNDYSFDATKTAYADWTHVTLYRNGVLVWGTEPVGGTPTFTPTPTQTGTPTRTPTPCSGTCPTPMGRFRVDAQGNITKDGVIFHIHGGSWFGLQGRHEPSNDPTNPSGAPMEQYMGNVFWNPSSRTYMQDVQEFKDMGINVVRIPLVPETLTGTDPQGMAPYLKNTDSVKIANSRLALETVIKDLDSVGIYVLLDIHSCSNYVDWRKGRLDARPPYVDATRDNYDFKREDSSCSATNNPSTVTRIQAYDETKWLADLRTLAGMESSLGVSNIMGIDIFNEPWDYTWTEWKGLTEDAYNAISPINPNILIFTEGVSASAHNQDGITGNEVQEPYGAAPIPNWGGNLYSAGANPPNVPKDRLVFSPHVYGISVFVGQQFVDQTQAGCAGLEGDAVGDARCRLVMPPVSLLQQGWDAQWGYLKAMGYAVVIGEWGGNMSWPGGKASLRDQNRYSYVTDHTIDQQWQNAFVDYLISKGITDTIYWSINPESGDTGGLYTTPYDPVSNTSGWGTWGALDQTKMTLVRRLWGN